MDVQLTGDGTLFGDLAEPFMRRDPFSTNVIGVHLAGVLDGFRPLNPDDLWAVVIDDGLVVGVAMHTPPRHLFVSRMPALGAAELAEALATADHVVPGVIGEQAATAAFAQTWTKLTGDVSTAESSVRMYRLDELRAPTGMSGAARIAGRADTRLVTAWFNAFHAEATPHQPADDVAAAAKRRLAAGQLCLWIDAAEPVSLAAHSNAAQGVARIGPVYSPPGHRGQGYGSAVTASATRHALDRGAAHVVLYADLANPTSNHIYQDLGYIADHDAQERRFDDASVQPADHNGE